MTLRVAFLAAAGIFIGGAASADDKLDCNGIADSEDLASVSLGVIVGGKVNFLANPSEKAGCPSASASCKRPAFLRGKDNVIFDKAGTGQAYICATFIDANDKRTRGWLPAEAVKPVTAAPRWIGTWKRGETADIQIKPKSSDAAQVIGTAIDRVQEAPHIGDFAGIIDPRQTEQGFATSGDKQVAYDKAGESDCAVKMRQLGRYLFVIDNGACGGAGVTFFGLYIRQ